MVFAINRNAVRDESERCSRSNGILFAIERNMQYKKGAELIHWELAFASEYLEDRLRVKIEGYPEGQ